MKNIKIYIILSVILFMTGCGYECDKYYRLKSQSYVCEYMLLDEKENTFRVETCMTDNDCHIEFQYFEWHNSVSVIHNWEKEKKAYYDPKRYEKYLDLCKKHNDLDYAHNVRYHRVEGCWGYSYYDIDPVKIEIVSNSDFDDAHPAGSSLGDLFYFNSLTPYPFIKNGYQGKELTAICQTLDKITPEEMILSIHRGDLTESVRQAPYFSLPRKNFPTKNQEHTFTITIIDDYDRQFIGMIEVDFSKTE